MGKLNNTIESLAEQIAHLLTRPKLTDLLKQSAKLVLVEVVITFARKLIEETQK